MRRLYKVHQTFRFNLEKTWTRNFFVSLLTIFEVSRFFEAPGAVSKKRLMPKIKPPNEVT